MWLQGVWAAGGARAAAGALRAAAFCQHAPGALLPGLWWCSRSLPTADFIGLRSCDGSMHAQQQGRLCAEGGRLQDVCTEERVHRKHVLRSRLACAQTCHLTLALQLLQRERASAQAEANRLRQKVRSICCSLRPALSCMCCCMAVPWEVREMPKAVNVAAANFLPLLGPAAWMQLRAPRRMRCMCATGSVWGVQCNALGAFLPPSVAAFARGIPAGSDLFTRKGLRRSEAQQQP